MIYALIIMLSAIYIVDMSGVMPKLNRIAFRTLYGKKIVYNGWYIPILGCSKCLSFWLVLTYALTAGYGLILSMGLASLCSYLSIPMGDVLRCLQLLLSNAITKLT